MVLYVFIEINLFLSYLNRMDNLASFLELPIIMNPEDFVLSEDGVLIYVPENISFFRITSKDSLALYLNLVKTEVSKRKKMGVLATSLNDLEKETLKKHKISFISIGDEVMIYTKKGELAFKFKEQKTNDSFSFTTLMSPAGFAILDTILNLSYADLKQFSALSLSNKFNLTQPKISQIFKACQVHSLVELKEWVISKNLDWWKEGFLEKKTRRFMTPFEIHKRYVSADKKSIQDILIAMMNSKNWNQSLSFSGIQLLKEMNEIIDKNLYLAIIPLFEKELFKRYSQVPAPISTSDSVVNVTVLRKDFLSESFFSRINKKNQQQFNILRMMWGIQTEDSRIQEARFDVLQRYLNEHQ